MDGFARFLRYQRDLTEVLVLNRLWGPRTRRRIAGDAASTVRQARFHAHTRLRHLTLADVVTRLSAEPVHSVTLPGPTELHGVGNAAYYHALLTLVSLAWLRASARQGAEAQPGPDPSTGEGRPR